MALCVFHDEKTPSLRVYPQSQRFHCYGCGRNGDVLDLVLFVHGMEEHRIRLFPEASQKEDLSFVREKIRSLVRVSNERDLFK